MNSLYVVAVVWTFNPKIEYLIEALKSVADQVNHLIIVDNGSSNVNQIRSMCGAFSNVTLIELSANLGVRALNVGMIYAVERYDPECILLLDDDTSVYYNAIPRVLGILKGSKLYELVGAICMYSGNRKITVFWRGGMFSGCLVKAELIKRGIKVREDFFLDQADHDFFDRIRRSNYLTIRYEDRGLINHKLGVLLKFCIKLPFVGVLNRYEPPWRYYYMVRNSTVLLMEGKLDIEFYIRQLVEFLIPMLFVDGIIRSFKALILGITHGLTKKLGYLDPYTVGLLSTKGLDRLSNNG
jgi:rhamnosyltransferase